ncbi:MAG TPA: porin, partial [Pseudolabrys sp.]|nr:porin [Pseudolabrys sp.]
MHRNVCKGTCRSRARHTPVQYVKICSLYGAGFFYIPGSDTCLKIGGYVRTEGGYGNALGSVTTGPI